MQANYPTSNTVSSPGLTLKSQVKSLEWARKNGYYFVLALVFVRFSQIHELITYELNMNSFLLFIVGIPALLGLVRSRSLTKSFRYPQAICWLGFSVWIALAAPFGVWKMGSLEVVKDYWRTNVMLFLVVGGLITTWKEFEHLIQVLAISCVFNLAVIRVYGQLDLQGRMTLPFGALANSNDYAAHLLMLLPSVLWVALTAKATKFRVIALGVFGYGLFAVLSSGSRGALISTVVGIVYFMASASKKQRVWAVGLLGVMLLAVFGTVSQQAVQRMLSFSSQSSSSSEEALQSSEIRSELLRDAVSYTFRHPLFGLGPENFRVMEGRSKPGMYEPAHNTYVQVACENGFPAFFFFIGGLVTSFLTFWRIGRKFRDNAQAEDVAQGAVCMQLMMVMFCVAVVFLNFAYADHFPMMVGMSVAMAYASGAWKPRKRRKKQKKGLEPEQQGDQRKFLSVRRAN